jgi:glyoxylase-like metal-dependent hydrolase (beta-lactamase superfamily II)
MAGIHRQRPGAADLAAATGEPAHALGDDVWMSPGVSNSYVIGTADGRVIVNGGLFFEGPLRRKAFDDVGGPTRAIVVTQGHADHFGGVFALREPDTDVVMLWEMYAGWFQHRSTTELYGVAPHSIATDVVAAAGADSLVEAARTHATAGRPVQALHLTDLVLTADPSHAAARAAAEAHDALFADTDNFWERAWLTSEITELRTK